MTRLARTAVVALVALVLGGLAGCGDQQRLGAAAVVDGHRISTDDLQAVTREYLEAVPGAAARDAQRGILERMLLSRVISAQARKVGVHASPGEVARERDDLLASTGGRDGLIRQLAAGQPPVALPPSYVDRWFKDRVLYGKIARELAVGGDITSQETAARTSAALVGTGRAMDIQVNPRYGRWRIRSGLTPLLSGGLASTAAEIDAGS